MLERPLQTETKIEKVFTDKQLWMLSITAFYRTYEESYQFNSLEDKVVSSLTSGLSKKKLKNEWEIHSKEDLFAEIQALGKGSSLDEFGDQYMIWDYARIFMLVRDLLRLK